MSKFSVKKPLTVLVGVIIVLILGVVSFTRMQTDLLPSMNLPYALVMTTYGGASPEEVELAVTKPVEQAMATISNISSVSSVSNENYSMVIMEFNDGTNMDTATIDIREKLDLMEASWTNERIGAPIIYKINPDMLPVMVAAVDVEGMSNIEISEYLDKEILPRLESVDGVASVTAAGFVEEELNVIIRQDKIDDLNERIQRKVKEQLEDAKKEMSGAKEEIEEGKEKLQSGKEELETKRNDFTEGMQTADAQLEEARLELLKKELEAENGKAELEKQRAELLEKQKLIASGEEELKAGEEELKKGEEELASNKQVVETAEEFLKAGMAAVAASEKDLSAKKEELENKKSKAEADASLSDEAKEAVLSEINEAFGLLEENEGKLKLQKEDLDRQSTELSKTKEALAAGEKQLEEGRKTYEASKKELTDGKKQITEGLAAIDAYLAQLEEGMKAITEGKDALNEKTAELSAQKSEAEAGLAAAQEEIDTAEEQLLSGESTLTEQMDNFGTTEEEALSKADISNTVTADMISNILMAQNFSMPAGYLADGDVQRLVRVGDKVEDVPALENLVLFDPNMEGIEPVLLSDVADVLMMNNADELYAKVNGNDAVVLTFQKQDSYATAEVSDAIQARFDEITAEDEKVHMTCLMDQGLYIDMVVDSVLDNLLFGAVLAIIILIFFLKDLRPTLVVACSIPVSVIFAVALMYFSGITLNVISLSGLAVAVGMLVDNSIVVIENIYRLRQKGVPAVKAAVTGAVQVSGAIVASTLTTVSVFLPIVFVEGITKQLFVDMALTLGYALMASLVIALTVVPAMASGMFRKTIEKKHPLMDKFVSIYDKVLRWSLRFKPVVLVLVLAVLGASVYLSVSQGTSFMPDMDSPQISVTLSMPEGATEKEQYAYSDAAMERIMQIDDVDAVGAMAGGNMLAGLSGGGGRGGSGSSSLSMYVLLKEDKAATSQEVASEINRLCADLPCEVSASGSNMDMSALGGSGLSLQLKGNDLSELQAAAKEVGKVLESVEGLTEISDGTEDADEELKITVDKSEAIKKGLTVAQVYAEISGMLAANSTATTLSINDSEYPVIVFDPDDGKVTEQDIRDYTFTVKQMDGSEKEVALDEVAEFTQGKSLSSIRRNANQRYIGISAAIAEGYNVGLVSTDAMEALDELELPEGMSLVSSGENDMINDAIDDLLLMLVLALALIYLIMVAQFQSLLSPFIVMFTIPLAFTGGFLGLWLTGNEISVISIIGFVMISGIIVNNGIVLVDYVNQLRREGWTKKEALVEAGKTRMRPILMTALTTILGLSTMAFGMGMGADMVQPIAIVAIGGMVYGTLMTVIVVPIIYDIFNRRELRVVTDEELTILDE